MKLPVLTCSEIEKTVRLKVIILCGINHLFVNWFTILLVICSDENFSQYFHEKYNKIKQ